MIFGEKWADGGLFVGDGSTVFGLFRGLMYDFSVFDFDLSEETEVEQQLLGILRDDFFDLLEDVVQDDLAGLALQIG